MINAYTEIGDAIYDFARDIDISAVEPAGWAHTFNRPFEPQEVTAGGYPVLMILPAEDEVTTQDSATDSGKIVYWVQVCDSIQNTITMGESMIRGLADLVRNALQAERGNSTPFGLSDVYDLAISGQWGWDTDRGERFYRCIVSVYVTQDI